MASQELIPQFPGEFNIWSYLLALATAVVVWFLAWGLKDIKKRYDKIPELEIKVAELKQELEDLKESMKK